MSHGFLSDPEFRRFLLDADRDLAEQAREERCPACGGTLHVANYERKPAGWQEQEELRLSFCCASEGCRKRRTPPSMRFLGRRVYLGAIVVLASILWHGATPRRVHKLRDFLGVSQRTLERWRKWWLEDFARSRFWRSRPGQFRSPVASDRLPVSLWEQFTGEDRPRLETVLRFLLPITSGQGLGAPAI